MWTPPPPRVADPLQCEQDVRDHVTLVGSEAGGVTVTMATARRMIPVTTNSGLVGEGGWGVG